MRHHLEKLRFLRWKRRPRPTGERPFIEVQYHPAAIRRGVRYLFLDRRQVLRWGLGLTAYAVFLVVGIALLPGVVRDAFAEREYAQRIAQRQAEGDRLQRLVEQLEELEVRTADVRLEMSKIYVAYGLSEDGARGQGGYPHEPASLPAPISDMPESIFANEISRGNGYHARIGEQLGVLEAFLDEVEAFEAAHSDQVRTTPSTLPLRGDDFVLTSPFGNRRSPFTKELDFHAGIDLAAPVGSPVYAPADGVVTFAGRYQLRNSVGWWRYGNLVAIRHGDHFITLHGHCDEVRVRAGQKVRQGDLIATVGNTGFSTNPHLHYEVRRLDEDGEYIPVDPRIYILDHRWRDEERVLIRARRAPDAQGFEPLPRVIRR